MLTALALGMAAWALACASPGFRWALAVAVAGAAVIFAPVLFLPL